MPKTIAKITKPKTQSRRNPWNNLVDFLKRVNAARRSQTLIYNKRLSLLSRIAKNINSEEKVDKILRLILKGAVNLTNSNAGVIFFKQGEKLRAIEAYGIKIAEKDLIIRPWRGIVGHVLTTKRGYLCNNTDKDRYFVPWATGKRAHSELAVPIIIDRKINGVLIVSARDYDKYSHLDENLLKDLSENASIAIKNAQHLDMVERLKNFSENIINSSSLGMLVADAEGVAIHYNQAAKKLFSRDLLKIGQKISFPKEVLLPKIEEIIKILKKERRTLVFERIFHPISSQSLYFDLRIDPLFNHRRELESILLTKENVTKKVLLEQKIREMNKILERKVVARTEKLKKLNLKLKESISSKMQFVADVSHELRTPLTVIQGNIELLQRNDKKIAKTDREAMHDVVLETKRISQKLESLIEMIHGEAKEIKIEMKQFELSRLIGEVAGLTKRIAKKKKIAVIVQANPKIQFIGDREKIKEMLLNIASNAVKYNRVRGKLWLEVKIKDNKIEIMISDTGIGISREDLPFIFDRFYRARDIENYKRSIGSGIGLAVSRFIAKAHGGEIKVESRVGVGTKFIIILPFSN